METFSCLIIRAQEDRQLSFPGHSLIISAQWHYQRVVRNLSSGPQNLT